MFDNLPSASFKKDAFEIENLEQAKRVTVGDLDFNDGEIQTTQNRWCDDTRHTIDFINNKFTFDNNTSVLDYGCGTGRISKELIIQHNCNIIGVDTSASMIPIANQFVNSPKFLALSPYEYKALGHTFNLIICLWVIQHCEDPNELIDLILAGMNFNTKLIVFNEIRRHVPTNEFGFANDGIDVYRLLYDKFNVIDQGKLSQYFHPKFVERTYWMLLMKNEK